MRPPKPRNPAQVRTAILASLAVSGAQPRILLRESVARETGAAVLYVEQILGDLIQEKRVRAAPAMTHGEVIFQYQESYDKLVFDFVRGKYTAAGLKPPPMGYK